MSGLRAASGPTCGAGLEREIARTNPPQKAWTTIVPLEHDHAIPPNTLSKIRFAHSPRTESVRTNQHYSVMYD